jgi:hypothetical protein
VIVIQFYSQTLYFQCYPGSSFSRLEVCKHSVNVLNGEIFGSTERPTPTDYQSASVTHLPSIVGSSSHL